MKLENTTVSPKIFYLAVLVQVLFLIAMIGLNQSIVWWGKEIRLEIVPVDPYSLFSGEYVDLRYGISNLELDEMEHPGYTKGSEAANFYRRGDKVYVELARKGEYWQAVKVSKNRRDMGDKLYITGRVEGVSHWDWQGRTDTLNLRVRYGIESYYTPEGEAIKYERLGPEQVSVRVAVDKFGRARVLGLRIAPNEVPPTTAPLNQTTF